MLKTALEVIVSPTRAFEKISEDPSYYWPAALLIGLIFPAIISSSIIGVISVESVIINTGGWLLMIAGTYYIGRMFKGKAGFLSVFSSLGYAAVPGIISSFFSVTLTLAIPRVLIEHVKAVPYAASSELIFSLADQIFTIPVIIISFFAVATLIWEIVLYFLACQIAHKFSRWKAVLTLAFAWISSVVIIGSLRSLIIALSSYFG